MSQLRRVALIGALGASLPRFARKAAVPVQS
jgi:hypothetical protein